MSVGQWTALGLAVVFAASTAVAADPGAALADAVEMQDSAAVGSLLKKRIDVNAAQVDGMTALHWAAYHDDVQTAKQIIAAGGNAKARNRYGVMPLSIACQNGNTEIVKLLLTAGADSNATLRGGETVLMTAARTGKLGPVDALIARRAKVNAKDRKGQTALMWAAAEGHVAVVDAIIEAGADFRTPLKSGFTPFFFAVREGQTGAALRLLAAGVKVNNVMQPGRSSRKASKTGTSGLILAVENGHFDLAAILLKAGADPKDQRSGYTALHAITWVRKPIRGDGDPSPVGSGKLTSLQFVRQLAALGADVNAKHTKKKTGRSRLNRTGATPFLLAAEAADVPMMQLLLKLGADPKLQNADNCTPLLAAAGVGLLSDGDEAAGTEAEAIEAIKLLLKHGADINAVDDHGESAMHGAAYKSWSKLVQFLADNKADIKVWNRKNNRRWTPLMIAQGHRPGNFRPSKKTMAAIQSVMRSDGVKPRDESTPRKTAKP